MEMDVLTDHAAIFKKGENIDATGQLGSLFSCEKGERGACEKTCSIPTFFECLRRCQHQEMRTPRV